MADSRFPTHSIVEKLGDALAIKLMGYFGSTIDGVVKVYLSLDDLSEYYEIREGDILHVEEAPSDELPYGGSAIWVKPDARVERCVRQRTSTEARFLSGEIAARMTKGARRNLQLATSSGPRARHCRLRPGLRVALLSRMGLLCRQQLPMRQHPTARMLGNRFCAVVLHLRRRHLRRALL